METVAIHMCKPKKKFQNQINFIFSCYYFRCTIVYFYNDFISFFVFNLKKQKKNLINTTQI